MFLRLYINYISPFLSLPPNCTYNSPPFSLNFMAFFFTSCYWKYISVYIYIILYNIVTLLVHIMQLLNVYFQGWLFGTRQPIRVLFSKEDHLTHCQISQLPVVPCIGLKPVDFSTSGSPSSLLSSYLCCHVVKCFLYGLWYYKEIQTHSKVPDPLVFTLFPISLLYCFLRIRCVS